MKRSFKLYSCKYDDKIQLFYRKYRILHNPY